jgi:hypothetical protein
MSEPASKSALAARLRVAVHAVDALRRTALGRVVAEAGHIVVDAQDAADVVLADGDGPRGETRPIVSLGGADQDLPGVLSRHADPNQIDAAIRAVAAGLLVRLPEAMDSGFGVGARTRTEAVAKASERRRYETMTL